MVLRWGIVSVGKISHDFVCALKTLPTTDHEIVAVAARSSKSAEEFAKLHNITTSYEGYEALAKDGAVDVVYVAVINPLHLAVSKLMLDHGKHVLCEKPLTMNQKETTELLEHAKNKKLFLMDAIWSRCFPVYKELRNQITSGKIGDVMHLNVSFGFPLEHVDRVTVTEMGGSCTLDIGVYTLQLAQFVFKGLKPTKISAAGHLNKYKTDESSSAILTYADGKTAVITCSCRVQLPNEAVITGTKGTIKIPEFWSPTKLITSEKTYEFELPESDAKYNYKNSVGLAYEAEEVRECIEKGLTESPVVTHAESLELAVQMDLLRKEAGVVL